MEFSTKLYNALLDRISTLASEVETLRIEGQVLRRDVDTLRTGNSNALLDSAVKRSQASGRSVVQECITGVKKGFKP